MKPQIDDLEEMLESIESLAKSSGGWFLPTFSDSMIKTINGHLSVIHTSSLVDWSKTLKKTIRLMKSELKLTELTKKAGTPNRSVLAVGSKKKVKPHSWESESIINHILKNPSAAEAMSLMHRTIQKDGPINFHKTRLGQQTYVWTGSRRYWVWENPKENWRVYVSNEGGTSCEVRSGMSSGDSIKAWNSYCDAVGLINSKLT